MYQLPSPAPNTQLGGYAIAMLQNVIANPSFGTTVAHFQATHATGTFDDRGRPDYLSKTDIGVNQTGVNYAPNPANPIRGVFCQAKRQPRQQPGGIYYDAQFELYVAENLGEVYRLFDDRPKLQDRFDIHGQSYYAIAPAMPCAVGDTVAAWQIQLNIQRYPV